MRWKLPVLILMLSALTACDMPNPVVVRPQQAQQAQGDGWTRAQAETAVNQFVSVVRTVEPVAERVCVERTRGLNCDFRIVVDDRLDQPVNAYQSLDSSGRPVIAFTIGLIADVRNADELAFVMSHEAAHHILNHLGRQKVNAVAGAQVLGGLASVTGASAAGIDMATRIGASVGARSYSKDFELEADALGAQIARTAGYDPLNGALYFTRIPDPGDKFLGTHPPNAARMEVVRRAVGG